MFFIIVFHHFLRFVHVVFQYLYLPVLCQHFRCTEAYAGHVYIDGTLHTTATGFLHPLPVLERVADQQVRGKGGDGIVEVAYFDRIQCNFYHCSVGTIFRHRNPVSYFQHIIGGKLYAGNKAHDTVFENQHQDGGGSAESGQQHRGILLYQDTDDNDSSYKEENALRCLQKSFQRFVPILLAGAVHQIDGSKQGTHETKEYGKYVNQAEPAKEVEQGGIHMVGECDRDGNID